MLELLPGNKLTRREEQTLWCIKEGMSSKETGDLLGVAPSTIASYRHTLHEKIRDEGKRNSVTLLVLFGISYFEKNGNPFAEALLEKE